MKKMLVNIILFEIDKIKSKREGDEEISENLKKFCNKNNLYKLSVNALLRTLCKVCETYGFIDGVDVISKGMSKNYKELHQSLDELRELKNE